MKVKVRRRSAQNWPQICRILPNQILDAVIESERVDWDFGKPAADEWMRRHRLLNPDVKTAEESLADFKKYYMPHDLTVPHELTPSPAGRDCLGNGDWPGYECQCDECEHFQVCFLDFP